MSIAARSQMIAGMDPRLDPETYCFVTVPDGYRSRRIAEAALAAFLEDEGWSFVVTTEAARAFDLPERMPQRRIVLQAHSSLEGVGLTAAVAGALAEAGIACNCVAAYHHDHIFVPAGEGERALAVLHERSAQGG